MPRSQLITTPIINKLNCRARLSGLISMLALSLFFYPFTVNAQSSPSNLSAIWQPLLIGLDYSQVDKTSAFFFESRISLLRFNLTHFKVSVIRATDYGLTRGSAKFLCQKARALACINANFFDENIKPLGLVVTRGMTLQSLHKRGGTLTGIFQVSRDHASIVNRSEYNPESVVEAIQAGPRLIASGNKVPGLKEESSPTRRSGVCIDRDGKIIFYLMSTGIFGISLEELREFLLDKSVQCQEALNLDGGGSAQLYVQIKNSKDEGPSKLISIEGSDEVPVLLGVFQR